MRTVSSVATGGSSFVEIEVHAAPRNSASNDGTARLRNRRLSAMPPPRSHDPGIAASSDVKAKVHDVAVPHYVLAAFESHLTGFLRALLALACDVIHVGDYLGADKALFKVGVDHAGRLRGGAPMADRPCTHFLRACGEKRVEPEKLVTGMD